MFSGLLPWRKYYVTVYQLLVGTMRKILAAIEPVLFGLYLIVMLFCVYKISQNPNKPTPALPQNERSIVVEQDVIPMPKFKAHQLTCERCREGRLDKGMCNVGLDLMIEDLEDHEARQ